MQVYNYISYDSNCVTMVYASMNSRYSKYIYIDSEVLEYGL